MPEPEGGALNLDDETDNHITVDQHLELFNHNHALLNPGQRELCDAVIDTLEHPNELTSSLYFGDGPAGAGKTFVYEVNKFFFIK